MLWWIPPPAKLRNLYDLVFHTLKLIVAAGITSAVTTFSAAFWMRRSVRPVSPRLLQTVAIALWFAPLVVLLRENSLWAAAVALIVVLSAARVLRAHQRRTAAAAESDWPAVIEPFQLMPRPSAGPWIVAISAALLLQGAVVAAASEENNLATLLFAMMAALLLARASRKPSPRPKPEDAAYFALLAMLWAATFTGAGLVRYLPRGGGPENDLAGANAGGGDGQVLRGERRNYTSVETGEIHTGIIVFPKQQAHTTLVAPLPALAANWKAESRSNPVSIPFFGAYWLFQRPDKEPPKNSHVVYGTPDELSFRATNRGALTMEAHQHLGTQLPLEGCRGIQVVISNADPYPSAVILELVLTNTADPGKPSLNLGRALVKSTPRWDPGRASMPSSEELFFSIPTAPTPPVFDAIKVMFHLRPMRNNRSAKIAIERFVMLPR